jgi:hypothetical protein
VILCRHRAIFFFFIHFLRSSFINSVVSAKTPWAYQQFEVGDDKGKKAAMNIPPGKQQQGSGWDAYHQGRNPGSPAASVGSRIQWSESPGPGHGSRGSSPAVDDEEGEHDVEFESQLRKRRYV